MINAKQRISLKTQTIAAFIAIASAVALPQIFHIVGKAIGVHTALGEIFLPMHLPVITVGLLMGPYAGAVVGFISPLLSTLLTGMPNAAILPFMTVELFAYGITSGLLKNTNISSVSKILITQFAGRLLKIFAVMSALCIFGESAITITSVVTAAVTGVVGIALQLIFIPFITSKFEAVNK